MNQGYRSSGRELKNAKKLYGQNGKRRSFVGASRDWAYSNREARKASPVKITKY